MKQPLSSAIRETLTKMDFGAVEARVFAYDGAKTGRFSPGQPVMRFWSSHAVAEAYMCNAEGMSMAYRVGAANGACLSGIVFA